MAGRVGKSVAVYTVQAPYCILFRMEVWCVQREREREREKCVYVRGSRKACQLVRLSHSLSTCASVPVGAAVSRIAASSFYKTSVKKRGRVVYRVGGYTVRGWCMQGGSLRIITVLYTGSEGAV